MELSKTLRFRNQLIGIAVIWITFHHSGFLVISPASYAFKSFGYGGVDFCVFASGIGCYFSLEKDPDILRFMKRRIQRLGPTYLCFIIPWLLWKQTVVELPVHSILGNILGLEAYVSWQYIFNWYIGGLILYYICLPYFKRITDSCTSFRYDLLVCLALILLGVPFCGVHNSLIILTRLPVLYAGVVYAKLAKQGYTLKARDLIALGAAAILGTVALIIMQEKASDLLWFWGLRWSLFLLIVPGVSVFVAVLAEKLDTVKYLRIINSVLRTAGVYSFELYLVHCFLYEDLMPLLPQIPSVLYNNILWVATIPAVVFCTYALNRITSAIGRMIIR